jgi:type IV fimbrial biogenesis protein FimT
MRCCAGWSLLELLLTISILLILLSLASPSLQLHALQARQTADVNAFVTAVQLARSEAAKRSRAAVLCATANGIECAAAAGVYEQGWIVFVDQDGQSPWRPAAGESVLFNYQPVTTGSIRSNRAQYVFRPFWRRSTNGTVTFCDRRGDGAARAVVVSPTGRPRVEQPDPARPVCAR